MLETLNMYITQYGIIAIFVIIFLEYLNMPGLAAGIVMPLAGIWAAKGHINFLLALVITLLAGVIASWILYFLGRCGGGFLLEKYLKKFPQHREAIERNFDLIRKKGAVGVFIGRFIPMIRTLIAIPAGILKMNFWEFTISSALGIFFWNLVLVGAGYFMGDAVLPLFASFS